MNGYFWTGEGGGVTGDFAYGTAHILSVVVLLVFTVVVTIAGRHMGSRGKRRTIVLLGVFGLGFEVFWRILHLVQGNDWLGLYPFYPCNLAGILIPIIAFTNNRILKEIFYVFAFIGGVLTFATPNGIFTNEVLNFWILKSVLQHTMIITIPVFEYFTKTFRPQFKNFWMTIAGMFVHLINSEFISRAFKMEGDFIFLRSGLPFVIDGVPGWLTLSVFAVIVVILFYAVLDWGGFKKIFKSKYA